MSEITEEMYRRVSAECVRLENLAAKGDLDTVEAPAWLFSDILTLMDGVAFQQMLQFMEEKGIISPDESMQS